MKVTPRKMKLTAAAVLSAAVLTASGCNNAGEGALSGAALGALGGLAIGSVTGASGTGAAIGAVAGGLGGAIIGDQNARSGTHVDYGHGGTVTSTGGGSPSPNTSGRW